MAETRKKEDEKPEAEAAAKEAVKETEPKEGAEEFPVERLIEEGGLMVGHPPHVVAGALHSTKKKNLTIEEAKAACAAWLKAPVKEG